MTHPTCINEMKPERHSSLEAGIDFVLRQQDDDGWWRDYWTPSGKSDQWVTGYVAYCLADAGFEGAPLDRAAQALIRTQKADGGWGYSQNVPTDADSTACALLFLLNHAPHETAVQLGLQCLRQHQEESGGVLTYRTPDPIRTVMSLPPTASLEGWCQSHLSVTAAAGRAFLAAGTEWWLHAEQAWDFLDNNRNDNGLWYSYWWSLPHYATMQSARLCMDLPGSLDTDPLATTRQTLSQLQLASGAWTNSDKDRPSPFATALALEILLLSTADESALASGCEWLQGSIQSDGSWRSEPNMRIPPPSASRPESRVQLHEEIPGTVIVPDQNRLFTSATCIHALASAT